MHPLRMFVNVLSNQQVEIRIPVSYTSRLRADKIGQRSHLGFSRDFHEILSNVYDYVSEPS